MKCTKFLGVLIDETLTWNNHIGSVLKKIFKSTGIISKIRHYTNQNTSKLLYHALVYPYLTYANLAWGNTYPSKLQKLMSVQKKIVRLITFKSYSEHTEPLFKKLNLLNIYKINDYLTSLFIFQFYNMNNMPEIFNNFFKTIIMKFIITILEVPKNYIKPTPELIT